MQALGLGQYEDIDDPSNTGAPNIKAKAANYTSILKKSLDS